MKNRLVRNSDIGRNDGCTKTDPLQYPRKRKFVVQNIITKIKECYSRYWIVRFVPAKGKMLKFRDGFTLGAKLGTKLFST